jgi:hypothetical protein
VPARLYVHDQPQPTLIVNDLKTGANAKGAVALWIDLGTVAHFRNLTVTRESASSRQPELSARDKRQDCRVNFTQQHRVTNIDDPTDWVDVRRSATT